MAAAACPQSRRRPPGRLPALAAAAAAAAVAVAAGPAGAAVRSVAVHAPRTFGYFIGDAIPVTVEIVADPQDRLDPASLPRPGALDYWLDLTSVEVDEGTAADGARRFTLRLGLQGFYAALEPHALDIPAFDIRVTGPGGTSVAHVPSWSIVVSPLREIVPRTGDDPTRIRPDASPVYRSARLAGIGLAGFSTLALAGLVALAANRAWWPFHRRPARPFTRAARDIARLGAAATPQAFLSLHRAFDAAAGRRLLADDVGGFFAERPQFAGEAPAATAFFARSRQLFFGGGNAAAPAAAAAAPSVDPSAVAEVAALARRLAAVERRVP